MYTSKHGFTIVELVVVIAVIAILAAVLIPTFSGIIARADESSARQTATNLMKEYVITNPNQRSFTDNGTEYYIAYFKIALDGNTYIFRYGMDGEIEQIDESDLPVFSGYLAVDVYETKDAIEAGEDAITKIYRKKLSTGEYLYYRVSPVDDNGNSSIVAVCNTDTQFWMFSGEYYALVCLKDIIFSEQEDIAENGETTSTITDAAGLVYQASNNGQAGIVGYQGTAGDVVIPDTSPDGDVVTYIERNAFRENTTITSIVMGKNITEIRSNAFLNCTKLKNVTLNDGIQALKGAAFYYCLGLTSINLPSSLKEIASYAFKKCQSLTSITVPDGCTITGGAFCNTIDIHFANGTDTMTDGTYTYRLIDGALTSELNTNPEEKTLLYMKKDCPIPENQNITTIGSDCFSIDFVTSVYIPDSVTTIAASAFYANNGLKEITGGNSIKTIGNQAFRSCKILESVTLSETVESLGSMAFSGCPELAITISSNLTFGDASLSGVKSINVENESTYRMVDGCLVDNTGKVCQGEYTATIPTDASITTLGSSCFVACGLSGDVVVPNNIVELQSCCFGECRKIETVFVGKNVTTIGVDCFANSTKLTSAVLEGEIEVLPARTFGYCSELTDVTLSKTIRKIDNDVFYNCYKLKTIHYEGTMAEWQSITFSANWSANTSTFSVVCQDGTLVYKH